MGRAFITLIIFHSAINFVNAIDRCVGETAWANNRGDDGREKIMIQSPIYLRTYHIDAHFDGFGGGESALLNRLEFFLDDPAIAGSATAESWIFDDSWEFGDANRHPTAIPAGRTIVGWTQYKANDHYNGFGI